MMSVIFTFAIALLGVMVFIFANLPLPWLLGPITFCLVGALLGVPMKGVKPLNDTMRTILGVAVGATLTPAVMGDIAGMWPTLLLMPVMVVAIGVVGIPFFTRVCGYDKATAYYSAMPGGLQDMLLFGEEAGGNIRTLSLIHATRVLVVVVALPFMLKGIWDADLSNPPGLPAIDVPVLDLLIMIVCAFAGWRIAKFFGLFGASILGPLILTAIVTMLGLLENRPPAEAIWAAQFFIGMTIGAKYAGITAQEVRKDVTAGFGFCVILIVLTTIFAGGIYELGLAPGMETLLAFTPGGQAELTVLALIVGADMAFVVAHHIVRIFVVILGAPVMNRLLWPK
ncbi:putative ammonia monooxygenase [Rhodobacterales bacterium HTCC2150]|nr:putative ammonia monooxygenase [Rhodobacterales bacterium HTCC2150] [Rhodobacteraceae bacterium HTCC2150]